MSIDFNTGVAVVFGIVGATITLMTFAEKVINMVKIARAPDQEQNRRLSELESWRSDVERYIGRDKHRIDNLEANLSMMMKAQFALLSHAINGNDTDRLRKVQQEMQDFLTRQGEA